ncbi:MAG: CRISPR-associated helicase Cas3', partial [Myxococcota bacterium]
MNFAELFQSATGRSPFPFQQAFANAERLPDVLEAPTGSGKTATAVIGWLWRRRFATDDVRRATPRRLVFCLPMRSLVQQTVASVEAWLRKLGLQDEVRVYSLLGGAVNNTFDAHPEADAVLVGTQDQLLSRALNRGYAVSRFRWPMQYALLNNDCLWVMDEIQLMGVGLSTSAQLNAFRGRWKTCGPTHTVWMSATLDRRLLATVDAPATPSAFGLTQADHDNAHLKRRLHAPKQLDLATRLFGDDDRAYTEALSQAVLAKHEPGTRTLVVVNRVARAQALFATLRKRDAALLHSRYRPPDRRAIEDRVLSGDWHGILIATQAIEAGVDISSKHMFTELAPWSSLVQRFGRTNRRGEWPAEDPATITVVDIPASESTDAKAFKAYVKNALPYSPDELDHARRLVRAHESAAPADLERGHPERAEPTSPVIRRRDAVGLFDTTPDLNGRDLDVSRWVRDKGQPDVQLAWRTWEGDSPSPDASALHREELCTVPHHAATDFLKKLRKRDRHACWRWDSLEGAWLPQLADPIPGHSYLLATRAGGYSVDLGWTANHRDKPPSVVLDHPIPQDDDAGDRLTHATRDYVLLAQHAEETKEECKSLRGRLLAATTGYDDLPWDRLEQAAQWHDLGKVHPCFQQMLKARLPEGDSRKEGGPWAKSDGRRGPPCTRR